MEKQRIYQITTSYACFGIITNQEGQIIETAPIAAWAKGRDISEVLHYFMTKKKANIVEIKEEGINNEICS